MKSGLPWNLSGVDKETREAVIEAARLSGLTVGEWLNQVLGGNFAEPELDSPAEAHDEAGDIAKAIERLTARLGQMDDASRSGIAGLPDRLDEIEHHISRLGNMRQDGSERGRSLKNILGLVKDLGREIDNADERARSMVEGLRVRASGTTGAAKAPDISRVSQAINELDQRIAEMRSRTSPQPAPESDNRPLKLDEIRRRLNTLLAQPENPAQAPAPVLVPAPAKAAPPAQTAAIDAALRALEDRIDDAKAHFEARMAAKPAEPLAPPGPAPATAEQIDRIEQRLADITTRLTESEAEGRKPKKEAELASAIREISSHQRAIDDRAETLAMRRDQKALSAAMGALRVDLGSLTEQVSAISRVGSEQHGAFFEVAQRIDALASDRPLDRSLLAAIRGDLETMRSMLDGTARQSSFAPFEARYDGISSQLNDLLRRTPDPARLEELTAEVSALRQMAPDPGKLDELGAEVSALRRSLEADDSPRAIQRLEMRLSELGRAVEAALTTKQAPREADPAVQRLEGHLRDISSRLEGMRDTGAHTAAIHTVEQRLDNRLNEIADRLSGLMNVTPQTIQTAEQRLGDRMEEVAARLGGMVDSATKPQTAALESVQRQLEGRLEDIVNRLGGMFDTAPQRAAIEHVHERLAAITDRIDTLNASQREPSAALDAIKSEIGALRKEVTEKEVPPPPSTDHLERQIRDLARQLETVTQSSDEGEALAQLEKQVSHLANELELAKPRVAALTQVEDRLDRMQLLLADSAQESISGARAEARKAVDELAAMVAGNAVDAELVHGLVRDLEGLRTVTGGTEQETRTKLESVSQTVAQVIDRLTRMEAEASAAEAARADAFRDETARVEAIRAETARLEAAKAAMAPQVTVPAVTPAESVEPPKAERTETPALPWTVAFLGEKPSTPSAEPRRTVTAIREPAPLLQPDKKAADRRADFIAAARRAAQAVAEEAASMEAGNDDEANADKLESGERKPGAFARISQAIRSRKRPLLLAAAAIVLAIGAMQVYGKISLPVRNTALIATAEKTKSTKVPDRLIVGNIGQPANVVTVAPGEGPRVIPLAASPDPTITFAKPETVVANNFSDKPAQPDTESFGGDSVGSIVAASASDAATPGAAAPDATDASVRATAAAAPQTGNPLVLASASVGADTGGLDPRLGSSNLLATAASGDPAAAFEIATRYAEGSRLPKNLSKAAEWYTKAAEGGVAVAQYRLGSLYERGQGVTKDLTNAVNWYQRAADQGNVNAMHNLAVLMSEGADSAPDHDKALQWFLAAANYGVRDSQYNLGVIYARGLGVTEDLVDSYKWFAIAASQGDTDASSRRDEVAKAMAGDDLTKARAEVTAWHVKPPIAEANGVAAPGGGWDGTVQAIGDADRQALVMKIQTLLAEAGYDPGPPDGVAGPKTVDAVKAYQRSAGVPDTGQIDKSLMASLTP